MNSSINSLDLRVRRTYKFLWEALLRLMTERDFEAITVTEICEAAMVHRTTFYKHYEDKYGLLAQGIQDQLAALFEALDAVGETTDEETDMLTGLVTVFEHVRSHEHFYRLMLCRDDFNNFSILLKKSLADRLKGRFQQHGIEVPMPIDLHAQIQAAAMVSMVIWWLENNCPYTPHEMMQYSGMHFNLVRSSLP
jgi:AcrR family transcriptional regulator